MPALHRAHLEWSPAKFIAWGERIGVTTAAVVTWQIERRLHPEHGYRGCLGLLALARKYCAARLEADCTRAMPIRAPYLRSVTNILKCGLDSQFRVAGYNDDSGPIPCPGTAGLASFTLRVNEARLAN
jgi:hypothetical protein